MFLDKNYTVKLTIGKINRKDWNLFDLSQLLSVCVLIDNKLEYECFCVCVFLVIYV